MNLIVTPNQLDADATVRCGDNNAPGWCTRESGEGWKSRSFQLTDEQVPYAVYLENNSDQPATVNLEVFLDGINSADEDVVVEPNTTVRVARIFNGQTQL